MSRLLTALVFIVASPLCMAKAPDCTNPEAWPASMAFVQLKNAGLTDNAQLDFSKTQVQRLASEPLGKGLYRQVHRVSFTRKAGGTLEVITVNDASQQECSMSDVTVYIVARQLGDTTQASTAQHP